MRNGGSPPGFGAWPDRLGIDAPAGARKHDDRVASVAVVSGIESVKRMPAQAVTAACISATVSRKHGSEGCRFVFKNPYMAR